MGEATSDVFQDTIFSNEGRYIQFTMEDAKQADYYFNMLMGQENEARKEYLFDTIDWDAEI